ALNGACLPVRSADFSAVRGLDAAVPPTAQDVDLCLRLATLRQGRFTVRAEATAVQHDDSPRLSHVRPGAGQVETDHVELWGSRGFTVLPGEPSDQSLAQAPGTALARVRPVVTEGDPRLRWAIKNPATT